MIKIEDYNAFAWSGIREEIDVVHDSKNSSLPNCFIEMIFILVNHVNMDLSRLSFCYWRQSKVFPCYVFVRSFVSVLSQTIRMSACCPFWDLEHTRTGLMTGHLRVFGQDFIPNQKLRITEVCMYLCMYVCIMYVHNLIQDTGCDSGFCKVPCIALGAIWFL